MDVPFTAVGQATLDMIGSGTVTLGPSGEDWLITNVTVSTFPRTKEATAKIYLNYVGEQYYLDGTYSGSNGDTTDTPITLTDGNKVVVSWEGGDAEATATVNIRGTRTQVNRGFRTATK